MPVKSDADVKGLKPHLSAALDASPVVLVVAGQSLLYGWHIKASHATLAAYVQIFDAAAIADVSVGTTTPTLAVGAGILGTAEGNPAKPIMFKNGICIACCSTATGSTDSTADVNIFYA